MIRVVLDTNILISAIISPKGKSARVLEWERKGHIELLFSPATIEEAWKVLRYPKVRNLLQKNKLSFETAEISLENTIKSSIVVPGQVTVDTLKGDPTDNVFLSCAIEGQADFIVSGDGHLNSLKSFHGIQILDTLIFSKIMDRLSSTD